MLAERAEFPIKMMARILGVSRSGFYSWLAGGCPEDDWSAKREAVRRVWLEPDHRFGARFVKCFLPAGFSGSTLYRVRKLMREPGIRGCTPNAEKRTTIPDPNARPRPDLVRRDFASPVPACKLVGDIACLRTSEGWLYLSTVVDLNTRMVVGWSLSERMTADIAVSALASAKSRGYVAGNAIFHADRGSQHASRLLAERARDNDVRLSCGRTGSCHDNAVAESFFATLKNETCYRRSFPTRDSATNPGQPTRRRLLNRGCDGFASSRSCRASPAAFGAGSRCRLQPRSAARGAGPRRSSLLSRRKNKITCRNAPTR